MLPIGPTLTPKPYNLNENILASAAPAGPAAGASGNSTHFLIERYPSISLLPLPQQDKTHGGVAAASPAILGEPGPGSRRGAFWFCSPILCVEFLLVARVGAAECIGEE